MGDSFVCPHCVISAGSMLSKDGEVYALMGGPAEFHGRPGTSAATTTSSTITSATKNTIMTTATCAVVPLMQRQQQQQQPPQQVTLPPSTPPPQLGCGWASLLAHLLVVPVCATAPCVFAGLDSPGGEAGEAGWGSIPAIPYWWHMVPRRSSGGG